MVLKIFELLVNRTTLRLRVANIDSCSNNLNVFVKNYINLLIESKSKYCEKPDLILRSTKNSNLLAIGHAFIELESVDSTNNYAMAQAAAGSAPHGTLFFAYDQWAGKGQRGRSWTSTPGQNIVLSAVLEPVVLQPSQAFSLSVCVALACHDFFSCLAGAEATSIKWPNDLYWNDRKAGGILIENHFQGDRWPLAIVGMGININQVEFPETAKNPVSLRQITGRSWSAVELARELGEHLDRRYSALTGGGMASSGSAIAAAAVDQLEEYQNKLYKRGRTVRLKKDSAVFETTVEGVTPQGQLLTRDVLERRFSFGEVEWII
ncbi:MAG: biotin--[acetyl-CoA-carboxylase] ligase [Bacteroidetes bacterium]|nr:biotin--[acetyl-CoA-carboxylase] ligase [Bacteroidota bacterium]